MAAEEPTRNRSEDFVSHSSAQQSAARAALLVSSPVSLQA